MAKTPPPPPKKPKSNASDPLFQVEDFDGAIVTIDWTTGHDGRAYKVFVGKVTLARDIDAVGFESGDREVSWIARVQGDEGTAHHGAVLEHVLQPSEEGDPGSQHRLALARPHRDSGEDRRAARRHRQQLRQPIPVRDHVRVGDREVRLGEGLEEVVERQAVLDRAAARERVMAETGIRPDYRPQQIPLLWPAPVRDQPEPRSRTLQQRESERQQPLWGAGREEDVEGDLPVPVLGSGCGNQAVVVGPV